MDNFVVKGIFPAFISPRGPQPTYDEFLKQIHNNKPQIEQLLLKHGALVFRGFPLSKAAHFAAVIESLNLGHFVNYIGGDSPRDKVEDQVYTSTEAPPGLHIPLHQELSYIKNSPRHIYFFCETPPVEGGETIIADARRVYETLDSKVKQQFLKKGLKYISHYFHKSKIMAWVNRMQRSHKSWMEVFETNSKDEVEKKCIENDFDWRWLKRDWIEVTQFRPAICEHPITKEKVWFNQAHLFDFNPRLLGWLRFIGAKLFYFRQSTRLHEIKFADGSRVPRDALYHILDVLDKNTVAFPWHQGDVMILDNILAMHGRAPFKGKRRILTALTSIDKTKLKTAAQHEEMLSTETE